MGGRVACDVGDETCGGGGIVPRKHTQLKNTDGPVLSRKENMMNTRYILSLCTVLILSEALLAGSAHAFGTADVKTPITDTWLTAKTKIALCQCPG